MPNTPGTVLSALHPSPPSTLQLPYEAGTLTLNSASKLKLREVMKPARGLTVRKLWNWDPNPDRRVSPTALIFQFPAYLYHFFFKWQGLPVIIHYTGFCKLDGSHPIKKKHEEIICSYLIPEGVCNQESYLLSHRTTQLKASSKVQTVHIILIPYSLIRADPLESRTRLKRIK